MKTSYCAALSACRRIDSRKSKAGRERARHECATTDESLAPRSGGKRGSEKIQRRKCNVDDEKIQKTKEN